MVLIRKRRKLDSLRYSRRSILRKQPLHKKTSEIWVTTRLYVGARVRGLGCHIYFSKTISLSALNPCYGQFKVCPTFGCSDPVCENALSESAFAYVEKAPRA